MEEAGRQGQGSPGMKLEAGAGISHTVGFELSQQIFGICKLARSSQREVTHAKPAAAGWQQLA